MNQLKTVPSSQTEQKLPEEKLWYAVIVQAFSDAAYAGNRRDPLYAKREAIEWMTTQGKDFKISNFIMQVTNMNMQFVKFVNS